MHRSGISARAGPLFPETVANPARPLDLTWGYASAPTIFLFASKCSSCCARVCRLRRGDLIQQLEQRQQAGGANDRIAASEPNCYGWANGDFQRDGIWFSTSDLSMAEKQREYFRGNGSDLHDPSDHRRRQWGKIRCDGEQLGGKYNQRNGQLNGERCSRGPNDLDAAGESKCDSWTNGDV